MLLSSEGMTLPMALKRYIQVNGAPPLDVKKKETALTKASCASETGKLCSSSKPGWLEYMNAPSSTMPPPCRYPLAEKCLGELPL